MTLPELVEEFLVHSRDRKRRSPLTLLAYRAAFDPIFGPGGPLAGTPPEKLTANAIDDAFGQLARQRRWKTRTLHGKLASTRAFVRWLGRRGHVPLELAEEVDLPRFTRRDPDFLSDDEVTTLFEGVEVLFERAKGHALSTGRLEQAVELRHRRMAMLALLVFGGLRAGEASQAKRRHLGQRTDGRMMLQIPATKGGQSRTILLIPRLVYFLGVYTELRADRRHPNILCSVPRPGQDAPREGFEAQILDRVKITQDVKLIAAAGLPDRRVNSNTLRHTCAMALADAGASPFELMGHFGWKGIETAMYYIRVRQPMAAKLDRAFKGIRTPFDFMVGEPRRTG